MAKGVDIFISYKRGEGEQAAREIENYLTRKKNYSVFRDVDKIEGGEDWSEKITRSIKKSDIFILLLTPLALTSEEVEKEVREAQKWKKRVLPCKLDTVNRDQLKKWDLTKFNIIEYSEKNISALLLSIDNSIDTFLSETRKRLIKKGTWISLPIIAIGLVSYVLLAYFLNPQIEVSYQSDLNMTIGTDYAQMFSNLSSPKDVAVDASGNVYVVDTGNNRIQKFTSDGSFIIEWGETGSAPGQFSEPSDITVDATDNIYVADTGNNRIQKFTSDGSFIIEWGETGSAPGQFSTPLGISVDNSKGIVYVADTGNNRIQKFTSNGKYLSYFGEFGYNEDKFNYPIDVDIDSKGSIYVADTGNNRIQKIEGSSIKTWKLLDKLNQGIFDTPTSITIDVLDNVYLSDTNNHKIYRFDSNGKNITSFGIFGFNSSNLNFPSGLAVDKERNIYVADSGNNQIKKFLVEEKETRAFHLFSFNESK